MIIKNAKIYGQQGLNDILIDKTTIVDIVPAANTPYAGPVIDAAGQLVCPPFVEPHMHLDSTQTAGEPRYNESGTLFEGIAVWAERKTQLTLEDVKARARRTLTWQASHGIQLVRTHVDVTDPNLVALQALLELKDEVAGWMDVQLVAFPQDGLLSCPHGLKSLERALAMGADVVGAIPHFEFTRELGVQSLHEAFALAQRFDKPVDVHCDEIDDEQSRFVETLAYLALKTGWGSRVVASHTTAMHSYNNAYASKLMRLIKLSGISMVANPLVNIHLQGRFDTYPKRRGMTRVDELTAAGINVAFGHDDIVDPWYPLGSGNPYEVLKMGLHVGHLTGQADLRRALDFVTVNAAVCCGVDNPQLHVGAPASFVIVDATDPVEAIRRNAVVRYSIKRGRVVAHTEPAQVTVFQPGATRVREAS